MNKKIINSSLIILSIIFFILSTMLFLFSFFTLVNFFSTNLEKLSYFKKNYAETKKIIFYNPGPFNIKNLSFDSKIYLLNKTFNFIKFSTEINANSENFAYVEIINKTLIEEEIRNYSVELINVYKDFDEVKNKMIEILNSSELVGNVNIKVEDFLEVSLEFKTKISNLIKI